MKILVFSDSHNHAYRIEKALLNETEVDLIIHLGDCISDIQSIQAKYPQFKYEFIPGNRDYNYNIPEEIMLEVEGKNFFITHSSKYFTQINLNHFFEFTSNIDADVILYGHTHVAKKFVHDGILYLNPGCMSSPPNRGIKTYMVINIEDGQIDTKLVDIEYLNKKSSSFNRPMKLLKIDIKKLGCTMLVFLAGELDHQTSDIVRTKIDGELISNAGGIKNLILDCSKVGYYDSLGIGVIIGSQRKFAKLGGKTAVVGMNPQTRRVLELTGFKGIIPFFDSIDDALKEIVSEKELDTEKGNIIVDDMAFKELIRKSELNVVNGNNIKGEKAIKTKSFGPIKISSILLVLGLIIIVCSLIFGISKSNIDSENAKNEVLNGYKAQALKLSADLKLKDAKVTLQFHNKGDGYDDGYDLILNSSSFSKLEDSKKFSFINALKNIEIVSPNIIVIPHVDSNGAAYTIYDNQLEKNGVEVSAETSSGSSSNDPKVGMTYQEVFDSNWGEPDKIDTKFAEQGSVVFRYYHHKNIYFYDDKVTDID